MSKASGQGHSVEIGRIFCQNIVNEFSREPPVMGLAVHSNCSYGGRQFNSKDCHHLRNPRNWRKIIDAIVNVLQVQVSREENNWIPL